MACPSRTEAGGRGPLQSTTRMSKIVFQESNVTITSTGVESNLLAAGEAVGLDLPFGCRQGNCTMCQQPVLSGEVDYPEGHNGVPDPGNALLCCCVPQSDLVIGA
jgi:ferredoxin